MKKTYQVIFSLFLKSGPAQSVVFYNVPEQRLIIQKYAADSTTPIQGATFHITDTDGQIIGDSNGDYVTDRSGQIILSGLIPGQSIVAKETKAASGYVLDSTPQTVKIKSGEAQTMVFYNAPKGGITVVKLDAETKRALSGAEFKITTIQGEPLDDFEGQVSTGGTYRTDENGEIVLRNVQPGAYRIAEIKAPEGYVLDAPAQTITVKNNDSQTVTFRDTPLQTVVIRKFVDGTTDPLPGVVFSVTDASGAKIGAGEYVTDASGEIAIPGLVPGSTLIIREVKTVKGYALNGTPQTIVVGGGAALQSVGSTSGVMSSGGTGGNTATFYDAPLSTLVIRAFIEGTDSQPLPGVTFKIVDGSGKPVGNSDGVYRTDDAGEIVIPNLQAGTVIKAREIKAADGYVLNGTPQDIEIRDSDLHELSFWNTPEQSLIIRKYITDSTTPIPGVTFHVSDADGQSIGGSNGNFVTDRNGEIVISGLVPGTSVTVKETQTASGYILDSTPQTAVIKASEANTMAFYNTPKSSLTVVKLDRLTETPLSGAEFKITTADGAAVDQDEGRTSSNGIYRTDENGRFTISGLNPGSYVVTEVQAPQGYVLDADAQTVKINANDAQMLTFRDSPTQTLTVEVFVTDSDTPIPGTAFLLADQDGKPVGSSNGEFISDENGRITVPGLAPGVSITVKEIRAAEGYIPDGTPKTILIKSGEAQSLRFYNSPTQTLKILLYQAGTTDPIPGASFHVEDRDGKNVGSSNGDFTTDRNGEITIPGLIPGVSITAKQTRTVSGFVLDSMPQTITIRAGGAQSMVFFNAPKGALVLQARDAVTDQLLPGVEFRITAANGEPLDANEGQSSSNGLYRTDDTGQLTLTKVQPGIYSIVETAVPEGYVLNTDPQTAEIHQNDTQTLVFRNIPKQTLTIQVFEEGTTKPIPGIALLLKDSGGAFIGPENGEFIADENGQITVSGLTPGVTVVAQEIRTVPGYVLNNVPKNIKIETGDAQKLTFFNVPTQNLIIQKFQKGTTKPLQGVAFIVTDGAGKPLDSSEYVTDENGRISIDGLEPGATIIAREIRTIQGYQLNGNPQNIQISAERQNVLTFYDDPLSVLILRLYVDGTENEPLSGAAFKVVDGGGKTVGPDDGVYYTDNAGMVTLNNLEPGVTVKARLFKLPEGFALDGTPQDILMESGSMQSLTFWAKRSGSLTIRALDSVTRAGVPNVEYSVHYADGRTVDTANGNLSTNGRYFTDSNGEILITGVTGTLVITEEKTADSYSMDPANRTQTVVVNPADGQTVTFFETPAQQLSILLYVKGTTTPISGARFLLTDGTGAKLGDRDGEFVTDENGRFSLSGLAVGTTVKVKQISAPDGFLNDSAEKTITIKSGNEQSVTLYNSLKQTLIIKLYEKGTTTPIAGAKFLLKDSGGAFIGENNGVLTTDSHGEFTISNLTPGVTITAVQIETISGYVLDSAPQNILIKSGDAQILDFYNAPKGTLTVRKIDSVSEKPLVGAEFKILTIGGAPVDDNEGRSSTGGLYKTDENGEINLLKLEPGVYTITETKAPTGYTLDSQPQTVTVNEADHQTVVFRDAALQSLTITKFEEGTTNPLAGVVFLVTDSNGNRIGAGEYTTDRNGQITIPGLTPGMTVIAREVRTVKGFVLNGDPQTIVIGNGANSVTSGAAAGSSGNSLVFYDAPLSVLIVRKYVEGTDNEPLSNVEFKITDGKGAAIGNGTFYTDRSGEIKVENLQPGTTVKVQETKTAPGYVLDRTLQTAEIPSGDVLEMTFWNSRKQTLTINKYRTGTTTPIPGVMFLVTDQNGAPVGASNGEFITDETGRIVIDNLTPGTVINAKETKAADGYALDSTPKSITIQSGAAQSLNFYNSPSGTLVVEKRDKATNEPLKGAVFQILTADGKYVPNAGGQLSSNGSYTTDDKGQIIITGLSSDTLVVKETKAPSGYILDDTPQTVQVGPNDTQTLTFYNSPEKILTIQKFVEGTTKPIQGVRFLVTDSMGATVGANQGEYTTDRNGRITIGGLKPGITITAKEIRAADGYVLDSTPQSVTIKEGEAQTLTFFNSPDGGLELIKVDAADKTVRIPNTSFEIRKMDGGLVKKITTGRDGRIHTDLDAGDYYLVEIEAANGYKLDNTPEYFTIRDGKTTTVTMTNVAQSGILLHKINSVTGKPIYGVTFLLYDAKNNPIGQYTTDDKGYIRIEDMTAGKYFLRELENKGYIPDTQMKTVYVQSGETTLIEWKNTPITAQIQITKRSADYNSTNGLPAGTLLEGAVFEIRDKAGNLVDTVKTDKNGAAASKPLPLERYTIRETKAPANYGINETEWTAYLEHEGQIVRFEITDKSLITGVNITKTGPKQVMNGQPVIYHFSGIANTSNVRLDSFYWRDKIPAQIRLNTVITGTYNFPGTYKITYRVNGGDPKTLADNLSTQRNYTMAASATALGLKADERVTEIMFVFGQAPAGFAQVEAPSLKCTAISNILAYSFVNEADVGGVYDGKWIQGVSRWVTSVYKKPVKLPKTGY